MKCLQNKLFYNQIFLLLLLDQNFIITILSIRMFNYLQTGQIVSFQAK